MGTRTFSPFYSPSLKKLKSLLLRRIFFEMEFPFQKSQSLKGPLVLQAKPPSVARPA